MNLRNTQQHCVHMSCTLHEYSSTTQQIAKVHWTISLGVSRFSSRALPFSTPTVHHGIIRVHSPVILVHNTEQSVIGLCSSGIIGTAHDTPLLDLYHSGLSMLKSVSGNEDFLTWHLIGWWLRYHGNVEISWIPYSRVYIFPVFFGKLNIWNSVLSSYSRCHSL